MSPRRFALVAHAILVAALGILPVRAQPAAPAVEAAEARFRAVASHLDLGGEFYFYLSLEDLIAQAGQAAREMLKTFAEEDEQAAAVLEKVAAVDVALRESGIYDIASVGASSKPLADGRHRFKAFLGVDGYLERGSLWRAFGGAPAEALAITGYAPEGAVLLRAVNLDMPALWDWLRGMVRTVGGDEVLAELDRKLDEGRQSGGVHLPSLVNALGDSLMVCGYLDPGTMLKIPTGGGQTEIPAPSLLAALSVKDGTLAALLKTQLAAKGMPLSTQVVDGVETLQAPDPLPAPIPLQPAMAQKDGVLLVASTPDLLRRALAAGAGAGRLVDSEAYARAFRGLPRAVNGLAYVDPAVSELVFKIQMAGMEGVQGPPPAVREAMRKWMGAFSRVEGAAVRINLPDGMLFDGISTTSGRQQVAMMMAAVPIGVLAGVAVPAVTQARTRAQDAACTSNLRMIDAAKQMCAMDKDLEAGDTPTPDQLTPYFPDGLPVCPSGGAYTPGPIGTPPSCSIHGPLAD